MPIYRYQCTECGAREEHLQKFSDPPLESCQSCGGALSKLMTAAAFHLKGGGWYKDLYSSSKSDAGAEAPAKSESSSPSASDSSASGSGGKSDSNKGSSSSSSPSPGSATSTSTSAA